MVENKRVKKIVSNILEVERHISNPFNIKILNDTEVKATLLYSLWLKCYHRTLEFFQFWSKKQKTKQEKVYQER